MESDILERTTREVYHTTTRHFIYRLGVIIMKLEEYESPIKVFLNGTFQNAYRPAVRTLCSVIKIFKLCGPI
jgi:hypothetical protein